MVTFPHASAQVGLGSDSNEQPPGQKTNALPLCQRAGFHDRSYILDVRAKHLGCYNEQNTKVMSMKIGQTFNRVERCIPQCYTHRYRYAGLRVGTIEFVLILFNSIHLFYHLHKAWRLGNHNKDKNGITTSLPTFQMDLTKTKLKCLV